MKRGMDRGAEREERESLLDVRRRRFAAEGVEEGPDTVCREEPLEVQVMGRPLFVTMRTPGSDEELALGFLLAEGVIQSFDDVSSVHHRSEAATPEAAGNAIHVQLREGVEVDFAALDRHFVASSSCGICGKVSIEHALRTAPPLDDPAAFSASFFPGLIAPFRDKQAIFERTGGLHAAALFDADGELLVLREDVGRHNAVDKVIGWALREGRFPLAGQVLLVSGRVSFEIVQKALAARIPVVAAVSAPTSLAVELAEEGGLALVAFLRGESMSVYGEHARIR